MKHEIELGYLVLEVPDPDILAPVFADVVGLVPGEPTAAGATRGATTARTGCIVQPGPANDAVAVGFEAVDAAAFDATVARLRADRRRRRRRRWQRAAGCRRLVRTTAPWGVDVEIVLAAGGRADVRSRRRSFRAASSPTASASATRCSRRPRSTSRTRSSSTASGFAQSDWLETEIAPGIDLEVRFYHCNARHHTLALARAPFDLPQRLHHVMFEMNERDDVGAAFDRAWASELADPERARSSRQRRHVQLLSADAGRLPGRGRSRRARRSPTAGTTTVATTAISAWGHQPLRPA